MKLNLKPHTLPTFLAGLGTAALILRLGLYLLGRDEKGLLISGHPLSLLVWAVTAAAGVLTVLSLLPLKDSAGDADSFRASPSAAMGCFAMAAAIGVTVLFDGPAYQRLDLLRNAAGFLAVPALVWIGLCRRRGLRPFFLFHALVCLYLTLRMVSHYQLWCSRPQLQDYFFAVMASVLLTLFAYYQTAFDVSMGKRRMQLGCGLLTGFFCLAAIAGGEDTALYAAGSLWALTNLGSLAPARRRRPNPITEAPRENSHESA